MALKPSLLGNLIYKALQKTKSSPSDEIFALEFTNAIESYLESASGTTADSGTISTGVYAGVGTLTLVKGDTVSCNTTILECCKLLQTPTEGANKIFATQLALAIYLLGFNGKFTYNSSGTVTQGSSSAPISDISVGNLTINQVTLANSIEILFESFNIMKGESLEIYNNRLELGTTYRDSDESFAYKLADVLKPILELGEVHTRGELLLLGSIGYGTLIFK